MRDPLGTLAEGPVSGRSSGVNLPFLPTLVTAVAIAALSFLCKEPAATLVSAPAPAVHASAHVSAAAFPFSREAASAEALPETGDRLVAGLAFAALQPLDLRAPEVRVAARPGPRVVGLSAPRKGCTEPRCSEVQNARRPDAAHRYAPEEADPFAAARTGSIRSGESPAPREIEVGEEDGSGMPDLALPFAPAARAVGRAASAVGSGAASLKSSVSLLVDCLR